MRRSIALRVAVSAVIAVVATTVFAELSTTDPVQQAAVIQKEILTTCGWCHEVPPPGLLSRAAWRGSFERMA